MPRLVGLLFICNLLCIVSYSTGLFIPCTKPEYFKCDNGNCITFLLECDGEDDCGDNSDEQNCGGFQLRLPSSFQCAPNEFKCDNYSCIPIEKFCDNITDCADKSDEYTGCVEKLNCDNKFRCNDGHCVKKDWECDGVKDCPDGSDELDCENKTLIASDCNSKNDRYLCENQRCILLNTVCDKKDDCGDKSDEGVGCENDTALCASAGCSHTCRITPSGPVCICQSGYKLQDNQTCIDIDECEIYGICDQGCTNIEGSYTCICQVGYMLQDDMKTCKADGGEATMIFSTKTEIRGMYLDSQIYFVAARNLSHAVGVALDGEYMYWSEVEGGQEAIVKSVNRNKNEAIVTTGLHTISDIAIDWITGNIYFTDDGYMRIGVCDNNGTYCTILINERNNKPRGIALLPTRGIMYWCDWGSNPHIAMAGMDGKNSSLFVTEKLGWPNSVTIDYPNNRLYWVDAKLAIIESIHLDGTDRRAVLRDVAKRPFSLATFENKLYWSDWNTNTIQSCDKFSGKNWKILLRSGNTPYGIHIDHPVIKSKRQNPCYSNFCSQLCLLNRNESYTCACTLDKELSSNKHTCRAAEKQQHIIVAAGSIFIDYYHELLGKPKITTSTILNHITAMTYDGFSGTILASDQLMDNIFSYDPISGDIKSLMSIKNEIIGGMAFDHIGNNLYLSDIEHKTIEVHSLTTMSKTIFYFGEQPCDIALVPEEGVMFVIFRNKSNYYINKMQMNGIGPNSRFIENNLMGPKISLCYDKEEKRIFWSDQGTGRIESAEITGFNKYLFRTGLKEPVSLTIAGKNIFWTQRGSNRLFWADKNNIHQKNEAALLHIPTSIEIPYLITIQGIITQEENGCRKNNGNCSYVCLSSSPASYICACPPEMMLNMDNHTCAPQSLCTGDEIKCSEHDICIKRQQWCNGIKECPYGEDEPDHCEKSSICEEDQFMCKDGSCIDLKDRCNSQYDCADRSDEDDCKRQECQTNEFSCHEGGCISNFAVCNGIYDCDDYSDELNCHTHTCSSNNFMCDTRECIPKDWECDGEPDCLDGSDETDKCRTNECDDDKFMCANGRCISSSLKCNSFNDCGDGSDERYCLYSKHGGSGNCTADEYLCYNTDMCLPKTVRCNGLQDCPKNDDEHNCAYCEHDEFVCDNQKCILQSWVCDKIDDCGDKSDEKECSSGNWRSANVNVSVKCEEFKCSTGACLPFSKVCDGVQDCPDDSDENGKCTIACALENHCQGICYKTPQGAVCGCPAGYRLANNRIYCIDTNECEQDICAQICRNTEGSFQCSCHGGYVIRSDKISCKATGPPMKIITSTNNDIRQISLNLHSTEVIQTTPSLNIIDFDVNAIDNYVYWTTMSGSLIQSNIKTKELKTMITGDNIVNPQMLAVDWVTNNVYFSDRDSHHSYSIKVCNVEQQKYATLVKINGAGLITALTVDPIHEWLFWSENVWKAFKDPAAQLYRSNMMGSDIEMLHSLTYGGVINGLVIDYIKSRLYWADSFNRIIESSNYDGTERRTFLKTDYPPLSISIFENSLYWMMGRTGQLQKCKLYDKRSCEIMNLGSGNLQKHFAILHLSQNPLVINACETRHCDHICILKNKDAVCICEAGKPIKSDNTCEDMASNSTIKSKDVQSQSKTISAIIITIIIALIILSAYYYYKRCKLHPENSNRFSFSSIRFHNPSYDRRDEIDETLDTLIQDLSPGEHEYTNPINERLFKMAEENNERKSETKKDIEITEKPDIPFISFNLSK